MIIFDKLFRRKKKKVNQKFANQTSTRSNTVVSVNDFGGSRTTIPRFAQGGGGAWGSLPKRTQRELGLDERSFSSYSLDQLVDILIDAHPDMSFALWNYLRISNSGYKITTRKIGSDKPFTQGDKIIKELLDRLEQPNIERFEKSRSLNKVIIQLILSTVCRGAASMEMVLTPGLDDVAFFAPVDPATISFRFEQDRFIPYQDEDKVNLDIPTFFYEGLDERIDDPYGRSPIISAISMILFQLQVLNDIKAVVHNQGYPRFDIKILEEVLLNRMPIHIRNNETEKQKWLNERLQEIIDMYNSLEPDDTLVHYDSIEVGMVGGSKGGGGATIDPDKLMRSIDNLIMSGLKTLSTILGRRSTGNTESFAKIEIKLYLQGVRAIQQVVESIMSRALTLYLNIRGKQGVVSFKFLPLEIRTEIEKAQFEQIHLLNCQFKRDQGWIDQTEASQLAVGHDPVSETPINNDIPKNKDGSTPSGVTDEKSTDSPTESPE